jgi:cytochrome o ubiquinol oxidase subunit 1
MPKNTGLGISIGMFVFFFGFGVVWHLWWLAAAGLVGAVVCIFMRVFTEETEYILPAARVAQIEASIV